MSIKFEMVLIGYSGVRGKLIHEKNLKLKISCQTPFKVKPQLLGNLITKSYQLHEIRVHRHAPYLRNVKFVNKPVESVAGCPGTLRSTEEWMY